MIVFVDFDVNVVDFLVKCVEVIFDCVLFLVLEGDGWCDIFVVDF